MEEPGKERRQRGSFSTADHRAAFDRVMAISRCAEYIEDFKSLSLDDVVSKTNLCRKWGLKTIVPPYLSDRNKEHRPFLHVNTPKAIEFADEVAFFCETWPDLAEYAPSFSPLSCDGDFRWNYLTYKEPPQPPGWVERGYIQVWIDFSRSAEELREAFDRLIKGFRKHQQKKRNPRKTALNKWAIWDDHHLKEKSLNSIALIVARKEYPRGQRTPAYNNDLWPHYKRVETAHKQAVKLIKAVENDARDRQAKHMSVLTPGPLGDRP